MAVVKKEKEKEKEFRCSRCSHTYGSKKSLTNHYFISHTLASRENGGGTTEHGRKHRERVRKNKFQKMREEYHRKYHKPQQQQKEETEKVKAIV